MIKIFFNYIVMGVNQLKSHVSLNTGKAVKVGDNIVLVSKSVYEILKKGNNQWTIDLLNELGVLESQETWEQFKKSPIFKMKFFSNMLIAYLNGEKFAIDQENV